MRRVAIFVAAVLCLMAAAAVVFRPGVKPNIVLIIVDTLRADKLGAYGNPSPASKELDQLAAEGIVLEQV